MHTVATPVNNLGHFDDDNYLKIFNTLSLIVERVITWISKLAGTLGLIALAPILYVCILISAVVLMHLNRRLKGVIQEIYNEINEAEESDLIKMHLHIERVNKILAVRINSLKAADGLLISPVMNQIKKLNSQVRNLEFTLYKAAYPEIHQAPSQEQKERLVKTFSDIEDWDNPELDEYDIYLK